MRKFSSNLLGSRSCALAFALTSLWACAQTAVAQTAAAGSAAAVPKMEDVYKNIQVFNGMPADQLFTTMRFIRASLGVACTYCHAEGNNTMAAATKDTAHMKPDWWLDEPGREIDTPKKEIARKMMRMTAALNKESFGGGNQITCFTCHRGNIRPASNFDASLVVVPEAMRPDPKAIEGVTADQLVDKFVAAVGGAAAIQKVSTRFVKGSVQDAGLIAGRGNGRKPPPEQVEISAKAPDMRAMLTHEAEGYIRAEGGGKGWQQRPDRNDPRHQPRDFRNNEYDVFKFEDPYFFALQLKQMVTGARVARVEKIAGKEAYVVVGRSGSLPEVQLYFDKESGMLVRLVTFTQGFLGRLPTQFDFSDFRPVDGVQVPYHWVSTDISEGQSYTYQLDQVQQNVPMEDAKFVKPTVYVDLTGAK